MRRTTAATAAVLLLAAPLLFAAVEGSAGGIRWTMPASWKVGAPQPMRAATYEIPAAPGAEAASCGVFFFGKGQGGGVDENLARWAGQISGAAAPAKKSERTVAGMKVHTITSTGTYEASMGMKSEGKKTGWMLSGAIVEAPDGLVFFKCVGPAATMAKAQQGIDELLKSIVKVGATKV